jgi:hypothetical protein
MVHLTITRVTFEKLILEHVPILCILKVHYRGYRNHELVIIIVIIIIIIIIIIFSSPLADTFY